MRKIIPLPLAFALLLCTFAACGEKPVQVNAPLILGEKYLLDLDYEQALLYFEQAIKIDPKNPRIQTQIEYIYIIIDDERADPENSDLVRKNPELFPVLPPRPVDEPTRVNWLLALIEALRKLNCRDLALELLERLAAQFPGYAQVIEAYQALAEELGIEVETSMGVATSATTEKLTTTAATTITTTVDKATTATKPTATSKATTTTKSSSGKIELSNYKNMSIDELARVVGCDKVDVTDGIKSYTNEKDDIGITESYSDGYKITSVFFSSPNISIFEVSVGDTLASAEQKLINKGYSPSLKNGNGYGRYDYVSLTDRDVVMLHINDKIIVGMHIMWNLPPMPEN